MLMMTPTLKAKIAHVNVIEFTSSNTGILHRIVVHHFPIHSIHRLAKHKMLSGVELAGQHFFLTTFLNA